MFQIKTEVPGLDLVIGEDGQVYLLDVPIGILFPSERAQVESMIRRAQNHPTTGAVTLSLEGVERATITDELLQLDEQWRQLP